MWLLRHELGADYECWIILCVTHLLCPIYACVSCLFSMCFHCYVLNICCVITNEHCMTQKCFVGPQYLSSPQESRAAGFGHPNSRQGVTKCRVRDSSNKCRHHFRVQTTWAHSKRSNPFPIRNHELHNQLTYHGEQFLTKLKAAWPFKTF